MKLLDVFPFLLAVNALFNLYYDKLKVFNTFFADPYHDTTFQPKINAVKNIVPTDSKRHQNKDYTKERNAIMRELFAPLSDLRYKIQWCIKNHTITDSLSSFELSGFTRSISKKNIKLFHSSYEAAIQQINKTANKAAIITAGFDQAQITNITTKHDAAWAIQTNKIDIKVEISDLSSANQDTVYDGLNEAQLIIDGLHAMSIASGDTDLQARTTKAAILATIDPTPPKKVRNRYIEAASGAVIATDYPAKDLMQITLLTDDKVSLYRCQQKTDPLVSGIDLEYNQLWEGKIGNIPGKGRYIKVFNYNSNRTAIISVLKISVKHIRANKKDE